MPHLPGTLRRFRFNLPQRIAAGLLLVFLLEGLWVVGHQNLSERDYQYARCGREIWESPSPLAGYYTTCGNIRDGILAYRIAGLPLTLNVATERGLDVFRKPEDRLMPADRNVSLWELRHQITHVLLLMRLPFLFAGCILGGGVWWVSRRLYGNLGGYTALALYCFSPAVLRACLSPNAEILATLGAYGGVYTCIGVAHAMQGPRRKWRPRIILLICVLGVAAAAHIVALPVTAGLGLLLMLWIAEGRRSQVLPLVLLTSVGAVILLFACYSFSPDPFSYVFRSSDAFLRFSLDPVWRFFTTFANAGITIAAGAAIVLYLGLRKSRYFGNTAPLFCAIVLLPMVMTGAPGSPWIWAQPFLITFIGGVFADAFESKRGRMAFIAVGAIVALQAVLCLSALPRMI